MPFEDTLGFGNGIEHTGNAIANILPENKSDKNHSDDNANDRVEDVHNVIKLNIKTGCKQVFNEMYGILDYYCGQPTQKPNDNTQHHHKLTVVKILPFEIIDVNQ
jgi:hypothetical protein